MVITTYHAMRRRQVRAALEDLNTQLVALGLTAVTIPRALAPGQVREVCEAMFAQCVAEGDIQSATPSRSLSRMHVDEMLNAVQDAVTEFDAESNDDGAALLLLL